MDNKQKIILFGHCACCGSTEICFIENCKKVMCKKCHDWEWTEDALYSSWFKQIEIPEMRDLTPEERESVNKYIKSISKSTGINIFDLYKEEKEGKQNESSTR